MRQNFAYVQCIIRNGQYLVRLYGRQAGICLRDAYVCGSLRARMQWTDIALLANRSAAYIHRWHACAAADLALAHLECTADSLRCR